MPRVRDLPEVQARFSGTPPDEFDERGQQILDFQVPDSASPAFKAAIGKTAAAGLSRFTRTAQTLARGRETTELRHQLIEAGGTGGFEEAYDPRTGEPQKSTVPQMRPDAFDRAYAGMDPIGKYALRAAQGVLGAAPKEVRERLVPEGVRAPAPTTMGEKVAQAAGGATMLGAEATVMRGPASLLRFLGVGRRVQAGVALGSTMAAASEGELKERLVTGITGGLAGAAVEAVIPVAGALGRAATGGPVRQTVAEAEAAGRVASEAVEKYMRMGLSRGEAERIASSSIQRAVGATDKLRTQLTAGQRAATAGAIVGGSVTFGALEPLARHAALEALGEDAEPVTLEEIMQDVGALGIVNLAAHGRGLFARGGKRGGGPAAGPAVRTDLPRLPEPPGRALDPKLLGVARKIGEGLDASKKNPVDGNRTAAEGFEHRFRMNLPNKPDAEITPEEVRIAAARARKQTNWLTYLNDAIAPPNFPPSIRAKPEVVARQQKFGEQMSNQLNTLLMGKDLTLDLPGLPQSRIQVMRAAFFPWAEQPLRVIAVDQATNAVVPIYFDSIEQFRELSGLPMLSAEQGPTALPTARGVQPVPPAPEAPTASPVALQAAQAARTAQPLAPRPQQLPATTAAMPGPPPVARTEVTEATERLALRTSGRQAAERLSTPAVARAIWQYHAHGVRLPGPVEEALGRSVEELGGLVSRKEIGKLARAALTPEQFVRSLRSRIGSRVKGRLKGMGEAERPAKTTTAGERRSPEPGSRGAPAPGPTGTAAPRAPGTAERGPGSAGGPLPGGAAQPTASGGPAPESRPVAPPPTETAAAPGISPGATGPRAKGTGRTGQPPPTSLGIGDRVMTIQGPGTVQGSSMVEGAPKGTQQSVTVALDSGQLLGVFADDVELVRAQPREGKREAKSAVQPGGVQPGAAGGGAGRERAPRPRPSATSGDERIVTARAEHTGPVDVSGVREDLRRHLTPYQSEGVAKALTAMRDVNRGAFLLADGTGVGKTRQILAVAQTYADEGHPVWIITPNEVLGKPWDQKSLRASKGVPVISGSYANDAAAMGVQPTLWRPKDGPPPKSGVVVTTYTYIRDVPEDPNAVYIFDESHALKNAQQGTATAMKGRTLANLGHATLFASATPADKPTHIEYLARIGILEGQPLQKAINKLGFNLIQKGSRTYWVPMRSVTTEEILKRMSSLFDRMTAAGSMVKREISLDGVDIGFRRLALPRESHEELRRIAAHFDEGNPRQRAILLMHQRRQQEPVKVPVAMDIAKQEIAAGRQVILFVARVNYSEVQVTVGRDMEGEKIKEVIASSEGTAKLFRAELKKAGIPFAELHGAADTHAGEAMAAFQSGKAKVLVATIESGGTGINLDDTKGDAPRTMIVVTAPFNGVSNVQAAGRVWRMTTKSHPRIVYLFGDTPVDDWNAAIIAKKMETLGANVSGQVKRLLIDPDLLNDTEPEDIGSLLQEDVGGEMPEPEPVPSPAPAAKKVTPKQQALDYIRHQLEGGWTLDRLLTVRGGEMREHNLEHKGKTIEVGGEKFSVAKLVEEVQARVKTDPETQGISPSFDAWVKRQADATATPKEFGEEDLAPLGAAHFTPDKAMKVALARYHAEPEAFTRYLEEDEEAAIQQEMEERAKAFTEHTGRGKKQKAAHLRQAEAYLRLRTWAPVLFDELGALEHRMWAAGQLRVVDSMDAEQYMYEHRILKVMTEEIRKLGKPYDEYLPTSIEDFHEGNGQSRQFEQASVWVAELIMATYRGPLDPRAIEERAREAAKWAAMEIDRAIGYFGSQEDKAAMKLRRPDWEVQGGELPQVEIEGEIGESFALSNMDGPSLVTTDLKPGQRVEIHGIVDHQHDGKVVTVEEVLGTVSSTGAGTAIKVRFEDGSTGFFGSEELSLAMSPEELRRAREAAGQSDMFGGEPMLGPEGTIGQEQVTQASLPENRALAAAAEVGAVKAPELKTVRAQSVHTRSAFQQRADVTPELVDAEHAQNLLETEGGFSRDALLTRPIIVWRDPADDRLYVLDGHHRLYLAQNDWAYDEEAIRPKEWKERPGQPGMWVRTGSSDRDIPVIEVFGTEEEAQRQAELANKAGKANTITETAAIATRRIELAMPTWRQGIIPQPVLQNIAAELRLRSSYEVNQLLDFYSVDQQARERYFPNGAETSRLGNIDFAAVIGKAARRHPKLMTALKQMEFLDRAVNKPLTLAKLKLEVATWIDNGEILEQRDMNVDDPNAPKLSEILDVLERPVHRAAEITKNLKAAVSSLNKLLKGGVKVKGLSPTSLKKTIAQLRSEQAKSGKLLKETRRRVQKLMHDVQVEGVDYQERLAEIEKYVEENLGPENPGDWGANSLSFMGTGPLSQWLSRMFFDGMARAARTYRSKVGKSMTVRVLDANGNVRHRKPITFDVDPARQMLTYKLAMHARLGGSVVFPPPIYSAGLRMRGETALVEGELWDALNIALGQDGLRWLQHAWSSRSHDLFLAMEGRGKVPPAIAAKLPAIRAVFDRAHQQATRLAGEVGVKPPRYLSDYMTHLTTGMPAQRVESFIDILYPDAPKSEKTNVRNRFFESREGGQEFLEFFLPAAQAYFRAMARWIATNRFMAVVRKEIVAVDDADPRRAAAIRHLLRAWIFPKKSDFEQALDEAIRWAWFSKARGGVEDVSRETAEDRLGLPRAALANKTIETPSGLKPIVRFAIVHGSSRVSFTTKVPWRELGRTPAGNVVYGGHRGYAFGPEAPMRGKLGEWIGRQMIAWRLRFRDPSVERSEAMLQETLDERERVRRFHADPAKVMLGRLAHVNLRAMLGYNTRFGMMNIVGALMNDFLEWGAAPVLKGAAVHNAIAIRRGLRELIEFGVDRGHLTREQGDAAVAAIPLIALEVAPEAMAAVPGEIVNARRRIELLESGWSEADVKAWEALRPLGIGALTEFWNRGFDTAVQLTIAQRSGLDESVFLKTYEANLAGKHQASREILDSLGDPRGAARFIAFGQGHTQFYYDMFGQFAFMGSPLGKFAMQLMTYPVAWGLHFDLRPAEAAVRVPAAFVRGLFRPGAAAGGGAGAGGGGGPPRAGGSMPSEFEPQGWFRWFEKTARKGGASWFVTHAFGVFIREIIMVGAMLFLSDVTNLNFLAFGIPALAAVVLYMLRRMFPEDETFKRWWTRAQYGATSRLAAVAGVPGQAVAAGFGFILGGDGRVGLVELLRRTLTGPTTAIRRILEEFPEVFDNDAMRWTYRALDQRTALYDLPIALKWQHQFGVLPSDVARKYRKRVGETKKEKPPKPARELFPPPKGFAPKGAAAA